MVRTVVKMRFELWLYFVPNCDIILKELWLYYGPSGGYITVLAAALSAFLMSHDEAPCCVILLAIRHIRWSWTEMRLGVRKMVIMLMSGM